MKYLPFEIEQIESRAMAGGQIEKYISKVAQDVSKKPSTLRLILLIAKVIYKYGKMFAYEEFEMIMRRLWKNNSKDFKDRGFGI